MKRRRLLIAAAIAIAIATPVCTWLFFKPIRILAPELNGVVCHGPVCVEDIELLARAVALHERAMASVAEKLTPLRLPPLTVFCSTRACYQRFGGGAERGATIFDLGIILPPESWVAHIVEHELIHMLQAQELGLLGRQRTPQWYKEGMPFLISNPPPHDLPEYAVPLVEQYRSWEQKNGRANAWLLAPTLE